MTTSALAALRRDWSTAPAYDTVRGLRVFHVDDDSHLVGLWGQAWNPGEQIARCLPPPRGPLPRIPDMHIRGDHEVADPDCSCGVYAYWGRDELPSYQIHVPVFAVIEGFGNALIGSKGFRCSRARLLALAPNEGAWDAASVWREHSTRISRKYNVPALSTVNELLAAHPTRRLIRSTD